MAEVKVAKYVIIPEGVEDSPFNDTESFYYYVEQFPDTGRWYIHQGSTWSLMSKTGRWIHNTNQNRKWTRFDTAEEAIELAKKYIDNPVDPIKKRRMTLLEATQWWYQQHPEERRA